MAAGAVSEASGTLEEGQVRAMFDRIASVYDRLNTVMTMGLDRRWRERAADLARLAPGQSVLDVATGTGELAVELTRRVSPGGSVTACDFSEGMLDHARAKAAGRSAGAELRFEWANALELPYDSGSFDAATVGFGARNFSDLARGLTEMARVVRPGGRVVVLELTMPQRPPLSWFYRGWFDRLVPLLGRVAGGGAAYTYLPNSVRRFPGPPELAATMAGCGLTDVGWLVTGGGIIAIHHAEVAR